MNVVECYVMLFNVACYNYCCGSYECVLVNSYIKNYCNKEIIYNSDSNLKVIK